MINPFINLIAKASGEITKGIGEALDANITNVDEKLAKKNELAQIVEKAITDTVSYQRDVLVQELSGSKLQRNWRPIVMLAFAFVVVYRYFIAPLFHMQLVDIPDKFWNLLELGMGGYVIGRSAEKIAETMTKNIDLPFLRRRDRDDKMK